MYNLDHDTHILKRHDALCMSPKAQKTSQTSIGVGSRN